MGKLVLQLPDGTSLDIPLDRERITIGRRADNDVCLPYPAVSAEHAAVVTILDDSFLEDLNSTNGTLVNGKPIAKHFLRERDEIDIGRQKLTYFGDADLAPADGGNATRSGWPQGAQMESGATPGIRATDAPTVKAPVPASASRGELRATAPDGVRDASSAKVSMSPPSAGGASHASTEASERHRLARGTGSAVDTTVDTTIGDPAGERVPAGGASAVPRAMPGSDAAVKVLTGASAGRVVAMTRDELVVGRIGERVVAIRRDGSSYRLVPVEGTGSVLLNGKPLPDVGAPIADGDRFTLADAELQFVARSAGG